MTRQLAAAQAQLLILHLVNQMEQAAADAMPLSPAPAADVRLQGQ
jgi:hypothetical protein